MQEINYPITGLIVLAVIVLIVYLIRKNSRDKKKFEKEEIQSDLEPDKHDEDHV